ncbi:MAG TPA: adenosylhomocysteinase [Desulfurococcales archaeon]|nr:adenosylhomocysteinase [Desulfurococcales archaeon]
MSVACKSIIKDPSLWPSGERKILWARRFMKVLESISRNARVEKKFKGLRVGVVLHLEAKTAVLAWIIQEAGAEVYVACCNPETTQDDVAAALARKVTAVYAWRGETIEEYYENIKRVLKAKPDFIIDDGADCIVLAHELNVTSVKGGTEETTTGVIRLKAMERDGVLRFPVIGVNEGRIKYLFDNRYGTGQSTIDGILRATNIMIAGKRVVIAGYGWVGRGLAMRFRGMGAKVIVTEVDPIKALEAHMEGFEVMPMIEAVKIADIIITATGVNKVVREEHFKVMRDGVFLANAGHFDVEIDVRWLEEHAKAKREVRPHVTEYTLPNGKRVYLLAKGRLVNLVAADGHPIEVMDLSFAGQFAALEYLVDNYDKLEPKVYTLPRELDEKIAWEKLKVEGIRIDKLTPEQIEYLKSWRR